MRKVQGRNRYEIIRTIIIKRFGMKKIILLGFTVLMLQGCTGMIIGAATDATIAVAKIPFKVGGAVIGAVHNKGDKES